MNFTPGALFANVLLSAFGVGFFVYAKKQRRWPQLVAGVLLMGVPYVVDGALMMLCIGAAVVGALWLATRYGC